MKAAECPSSERDTLAKFMPKPGSVSGTRARVRSSRLPRLYDSARLGNLRRASLPPSPFPFPRWPFYGFRPRALLHPKAPAINRSAVMQRPRKIFPDAGVAVAEVRRYSSGSFYTNDDGFVRAARRLLLSLLCLLFLRFLFLVP